MPKWESLSSLFQRVPLEGWHHVHPMFGDIFFDLDGNRIERGQKFNPGAKRLPAVLSNAKTVLGDLIPSTSWGSSLANLLTKTSWDGLRLPLIEANHSVCELCGQLFHTLDAHEIWSYEFPPEAEWERRTTAAVFGTQKLEGLMAICHDCHMCFHLGRAQVDGTLSATLERLAALNDWPENTRARYHDTIFARHKLTSEIFWALDLSMVRHPDGGITVRKRWIIDEQDPRVLTAPNKFDGNSVTVLLEVPWKFAQEETWREPLPRSAPIADDENKAVPAPALASKPEKPVLRTPRPAWNGKYDELGQFTLASVAQL